MECGVPYCILRPNFYMQNFLKYFKSPIQKEGKFYCNLGNKKISCVDNRNVADMACKVMTDPIDRHRCCTYYCTGSQAFTMREMAEMITKVCGKKVEYCDVSDNDFYHYMQQTCKMDEPSAHGLLKMFQFYKMGKASCCFGDCQIVLERPPRTAEKFFRDHSKEIFEQP